MAGATPKYTLPESFSSCPLLGSWWILGSRVPWAIIVPLCTGVHLVDHPSSFLDSKLETNLEKWMCRFRKLVPCWGAIENPLRKLYHSFETAMDHFRSWRVAHDDQFVVCTWYWQNSHIQFNRTWGSGSSFMTSSSELGRTPSLAW